MRYNVKVRFSSDGLISFHGDEITVAIQSSPEKGKANRELIEVLSRFFKVEKNRLAIIAGHKSRNKVIELNE